jgi:hypothetical protein
VGFDFEKLSAAGADARDSFGGAGTVFVKGSHQQHGELRVDNGGQAPSTTYVADTPVEGGDYDRFEVTGGARVDVSGDLLVEDLVLGSGDLAVDGSAWIGNSGTLVIATSSAFSSFSAPNTTSLVVRNASVFVGGDWGFPSGIPVTVSDSATLAVSNGWNEIPLSSLSVLSNSVVTSQPSTSAAARPLVLTVAGAVLVDSTSRIDVSGKGYLGAWSGDNQSALARTRGNELAPEADAGGSFGGYGGFAGAKPMDTYGDYAWPVELGSGGTGTASYPGGNGGGLVIVTASSLQLDGSIRANGARGSRRGGSGGAVAIFVDSLAGGGNVEANGNYDSGGGRIAVHFGTNSDFNLAGNLLARGDSYGGAGTVFTKSGDQAYGDLRVDNGGRNASYVWPTPFLPTGTGELLFDRVSVLRYGRMTTPDNLIVTGAIVVDPNSGLTAANMTLP